MSNNEQMFKPFLVSLIKSNSNRPGGTGWHNGAPGAFVVLTP
jgi:hypothetical protein